MSGRQDGLRMFLQYWLLIAALGGFNIYTYMKSGSKASLAVSIVCVVTFIGWVFFYIFYVRKRV